MMDGEVLAVIIVFIFAGLLIWIFHEEYEKGNKVSVLYGYPANKKTWLTIYHCRTTDRWIFEWDDLFDSGRPKSMYPLHLNLMYPDKKSGATPEEHAKAMAMLNAR